MKKLNLLLLVLFSAISLNINAYDFEMRVLSHLNTNPMTGKPRKKVAERLFCFSANNKLFEFYKNAKYCHFF